MDTSQLQVIALEGVDGVGKQARHRRLDERFELCHVRCRRCGGRRRGAQGGSGRVLVAKPKATHAREADAWLDSVRHSMELMQHGKLRLQGWVLAPEAKAVGECPSFVEHAVDGR